jgi:ParB-like chromosome segregation protein Spo0J
MTISNGVPVDQCAALECDPICREYDNFTPEEYDLLCEDIRTNGLLVPIVVWKGRAVDGRHRLKICRELGNLLKIEDITESCPTEEMMRARVASLNQHRRSRTTPVSNAEKHARVEAALKADPKRSDRAIAEETGASHPTVSTIRKELEAKGVENLPPSERKSRRGRKGEGAQHTTGQRARKPAPSKTENLPEPQHAPAPAPELPQTPEAPEPAGDLAPSDDFLDRNDPKLVRARYLRGLVSDVLSTVHEMPKRTRAECFEQLMSEYGDDLEPIAPQQPVRHEPDGAAPEPVGDESFDLLCDVRNPRERDRILNHLAKALDHIAELPAADDVVRVIRARRLRKIDQKIRRAATWFNVLALGLTRPETPATTADLITPFAQLLALRPALARMARDSGQIVRLADALGRYRFDSDDFYELALSIADVTAAWTNKRLTINIERLHVVLDLYNGVLKSDGRIETLLAFIDAFDLDSDDFRALAHALTLRAEQQRKSAADAADAAAGSDGAPAAAGDAAQTKHLN